MCLSAVIMIFERYLQMDTDLLAEKYGLDAFEREELSEYLRNRFDGAREHDLESFEQLAVWKKLAVLAEMAGAAEVINRKLIPKCPVEFADPDGVRLEIFDSFAGEIPIVYTRAASDFEALVTNIVHKGKRPENIGHTGASFISGRTVRFIILSAKPYSNVTADELGIEDDDWAERSLLIRRSHECTHYFTKQVYGISNNILHDELMADLIGLYDACGQFKAEWFLRFMGVIKGSGGRLAVYTGGLSAKVRCAVEEILVNAAEGLEKWSLSDGFKELDNAERIKIMCHAGICGMADLQN